jgi:hypothetical protein
MSTVQNGGSQLKDLAVVPPGGNGKPPARSVQPAFDGMIGSACNLGISREAFIEMARFARTSDPRAARFLDSWDALSASEQQLRGAADAVCMRIGLAPIDLLTVVMDVGIRFSICGAQIKAAMALSSIVERSIETALTPEGVADRKMLFQHAGFLPITKTSQTAYSAIRNADGNNSTQAPGVSMPPIEHTIRTLSERLNEARGLSRTGAAALPQRASAQPLPDTSPEDEEGDGE